MNDSIVKPLPYRYDLAEPLKKTYLNTLFVTDDKEAHRFDISIFRDNVPIELPEGTSVSGCFIRYSDNKTILLKGSKDGNVASVTLDEACYSRAGQFALVIKVLDGSVINAVFCGEGSVLASRTDTVIADEHIVPSLAELLTLADRASEATRDALTAAEAARKAIEGFGFTVLGQYDTPELLQAAHPAGNPGDAYAVGAEEPYALYIWDMDTGAWKSLGQININGVGRDEEIQGLKSKILAMSGGLFNFDKTLNAIKKNVDCVVSEVSEPTDTSTVESVDIKCGYYGIKVRLRLDANASYMYRISNINGYNINLGSLYVATGSSRIVTIREINIDNKVHEDFSALKTVNFTFKRLMLIYEATATYNNIAYTCTTTLCITPDGFSILETISDEAVKSRMPTGFITNSGGYIREKATHGNRLVFGFSSNNEGPWPNTYVETIEEDGLTSFRKISFEGV